MSEKQPEALRLADTFEGAAQMMEAASDDYFYKGAAELRRQHTLLEEMAGASRGLLDALPSATTHPAIVTMRAILAKWDGIEMSDYMKEAERLIEEYGNAEWKVGKMSEHSDDAEEIVTRENARAALLAHIQRGAAEHSLEDVRCGCCGYMTYHREHMGCIRAAAPAPDQFPDAAKMMAEPAEVPMPEPYCHLTTGSVEWMRNSPETRTVSATASGKPNENTRPVFLVEQMQLYGDAREAAGYARGMAAKGGA